MTIQAELFAFDPVTIANVQDGCCRFPIDAEPSADMRLCGAPCSCTEPYCPEHTRRCWIAAPKKREHV